MKSRDRLLETGLVDAGDSKRREPLKFRTIWISDVHLGTTGCQAKKLWEFLKATESDKLYLVGDIVDGWQLKRRWYWDQKHNNVVQLVLKKAKKGTKVTLIPGNHDEACRQFIGLDFGGIKIRDELIHTTANGKRMLVLHGDRFDGVIACAKWLAYLGDNMYTVSANSGNAVVGYSGGETASTIASGALEMSNVDLAQEFTNMIIAQRGFQANSKMITTSDDMLQQLVDVKR